MKEERFMSGPTAPKPRRSHAERRDQSEQALLIAAASIIEERGLAAATVDAIAQSAGYSRGLASQKFGSKDALIRAVIAFATNKVEHAYQEQIGQEPSPLACILAYHDVLLSQLESDRLFRAYFVMMAGNIGNRTAMQPAFLEAHEGVRAKLRELIEAGQAAGEIAPELEADLVALSLGSLQLGISIEWLLDPDMDMAALRATVKGAVLRILAVQRE